MMGVASSVRLTYGFKIYYVSRLRGVVGLQVVILPCFVSEEVVAVKAQAGVVRKEQKSSSQADLFLMRANATPLH